MLLEEALSSGWIDNKMSGLTIPVWKVLHKKKVTFRSPRSVSPLLSPLETEEQRVKEIRRIILVKKGGHRGDTYIESCVAYCLTSLI